MPKPAFDPSQSFQPVADNTQPTVDNGQVNAKPAFDPNKPFQPTQDAQQGTPQQEQLRSQMHIPEDPKNANSGYGRLLSKYNKGIDSYSPQQLQDVQTEMKMGQSPVQVAAGQAIGGLIGKAGGAIAKSFASEAAPAAEEAAAPAEEAAQTITKKVFDPFTKQYRNISVAAPSEAASSATPQSDNQVSNAISGFLSQHKKEGVGAAVGGYLAHKQGLPWQVGAALGAGVVNQIESGALTKPIGGGLISSAINKGKQ